MYSPGKSKCVHTTPQSDWKKYSGQTTLKYQLKQHRWKLIHTSKKQNKTLDRSHKPELTSSRHNKDKMIFSKEI